MFASITRIVPAASAQSATPAEVQAVVGDRQAVARAAAAAGSPRARGSRGTRRPLLYACLQRVEAVRDELEVLVLVVGQVGDQDRRLAVDQADQADGPAGDGVGDEQLLAVDDVVIAVERRPSSAGPSGPTRRPARSGRTPRAARRWPARAGSAASARACRRCAAGRRRRCSRGPRPARRPSGRCVAIRVRNRANARERGPWPPYSRVDQQAPVAGAGQVARGPARRSCRRSSSSVPASRWRRTTSSESSITASQAAGRPATARAGTGRRGPRGPRRRGGSGCARSGSGARTAPRPARRPGRASPVVRASSSLLPPSFSAVSTKVSPGRLRVVLGLGALSSSGTSAIGSSHGGPPPCG